MLAALALLMPAIGIAVTLWVVPVQTLPKRFFPFGATPSLPFRRIELPPHQWY